MSAKIYITLLAFSHPFRNVIPSLAAWLLMLRNAKARLENESKARRFSVMMSFFQIRLHHLHV